MKFDSHKAKASRKWKSKNGQPPPRPFRGQSEAETVSNDSQDEQDEGNGKTFSRRKLESNAFRYEEPAEDEELEEEDKEAREVEKLTNLVKQSADRKDASAYFHFSSEKDWLEGGEVTSQASAFDDLFTLDIAALETSLSALPIDIRLGIDFSEFPEILEGSGDRMPEKRIPGKEKTAFLDSWEYAHDDAVQENPSSRISNEYQTKNTNPVKESTKSVPSAKVSKDSKKPKPRSDDLSDLDDLFDAKEPATPAKNRRDTPKPEVKQPQNTSIPARTIDSKASPKPSNTTKIEESDDLDWLDDMLSK
ncbi:hypothetical protein HDU67_008699 [Dinochytrium kinnereticum]|nr:hypothetical protein HDU67_008699 [Dinochytrium kinnereticum]